MNWVFELGTANAYTVLSGNDVKAVKKVEEAIYILKSHDIKIMEIDPFRKYSFEQYYGWRERFGGRSLSMIL